MLTSAERIAFILANLKPQPQECFNCWSWTVDTHTDYEGHTWCSGCWPAQLALDLDNRRAKAGA